MRTACSLIVMPRSRSRSIVSRTWSCMSRWLIEPVCSSSRSARVDLPWSMWAMMQKFRTSACFVVTDTFRMLGIMAIVLVIGVLLAVVGIVLLFNVAGAADFVMRHVTSKNLGTLPPGFANSKPGFRIYSALLISLGPVFIRLFLAAPVLVLGLTILCAGIAGFGTTPPTIIRPAGLTARVQKPY